MGNLFRPDSPLVRFMMRITNLLCLNVLWIVCSLPIVTVGAATTAMYYVMFQIQTNQDDAVLKPFFYAFRQNFRSVTPTWCLNLVVGAALAAECFYLSRDVLLLKLVCGVLLLIYAAVSTILYPLVARYDVSIKRQLLNSLALTVRHPLSAAAAVVLNAVPWALLIFSPEVFQKLALLWLLGGFSLTADLNSRILLLVFRRYDAQPKHETAAAHVEDGQTER